MSVEALTSHRTERIRVELLDRRDRLKGTLGGVAVGGTIELNVNREIRGGGNIVVMRDDEPVAWPYPEGTILVAPEDVDWYSDRIRVWWDVEDGPSWALGTFLITAPSESFYDGWKARPLELLDKLAVPSQDAVSATYSLPAGTVITDAVRELILSTGETRMAITDSDATLGAGQVWEGGTAKLRIINDLLASVNYFSLWCDGVGQYRAEPYVRPDARPPSWDFREGATAIHSPEWGREQDLYSVPNRVVLVSQGSGEETALTSVYPDPDNGIPEPDPSSPTSFARRGRWITHVETGVEANSQVVLDSMARQRLISLSSAVANLQVAHAALPLNLNDTVSFESQGHQALAVVQSMSYTLSSGSLVSAEWREVQL